MCWLRTKANVIMNEFRHPIRVLIVDDHPVVLRGIAARLRQNPHIELVGVASDGLEGLELARVLQPDVVVADEEMPVVSGESLAKLLSLELPKIRVLIYSAYDTPGLVTRLVKAGAAGFVVKESSTEELLRCILFVAQGNASFGGGISGSHQQN
jgi:two-component system nitrate/nitrite response regulator NarL